MAFHCLLAYIFLMRSLPKLFVPLDVIMSFFVGCLSDLSLYLVFSNSNKLCLGMVFFLFCLFCFKDFCFVFV